MNPIAKLTIKVNELKNRLVTDAKKLPSPPTSTGSSGSLFDDQVCVSPTSESDNYSSKRQALYLTERMDSLTSPLIQSLRLSQQSDDLLYKSPDSSPPIGMSQEPIKEA